MSLLGLGIDDATARDYVVGVRSAAGAALEERVYLAEGRIAQFAQGPVKIPDVNSPMRDAWDELVEACGRYVVNFQVDGRRLFSLTGSDGLDTFLERYDPGSVNYNAAVYVFAKDLLAVLELKRQRGAVARDGLAFPESLVSDPFELAALGAGSVEVAADLVRELEEERLLGAHYAELDLLAADLTDRGECDSYSYMPDPVGAKEIAERLAVKDATVHQWTQRGLLPPATYPAVGGRPAWEWSVVEAWAVETGRYRLDD